MSIIPSTFTGSVRRTVPKVIRSAIREAIQARMMSPKDAWDFFFPFSRITIRENPASPWIELSRQEPRAIRNDLLLADFHLPMEARPLIGREVDLELSFESIRPTDLREYTIHFKWLTDKADLSVTVNGRPEWVLATAFPVGPTNFKIAEPEDDGMAIKRFIKTEDIVMPKTYVSIRWYRVSS